MNKIKYRPSLGPTQEQLLVEICDALRARA